MDGLKKSIEIEKERFNLVQIDNIATLYKCNVPLTELEQDLLIHVISKIKNWDKPGEYAEIKFNASNFLKITKRKTHTYENIREALEHLTNIPVRIGNNDCGHWLSWTTSEPNTSDFVVDFPRQMKGFLGYIEGLYVKFNADFVYRLSGSYSKKIYMILKAALKGKESESIKIELSELKELLGIDNKYNLYGHLKTRVIIPSQKEINTKTDIDFTFTEIKSSHAVSSIEFDIFNNHENKIDSSDENIIRTVLKQRGFFDKTIDAFIKYSQSDVTTMQKWENKANEILAKNQSENENENIVIDEELKNTILLEIAELNKKPEAEPKPKKEKNNETDVIYSFLKDGGFSNKMIDEYVKLSNNNIEIMQNWFNYATIYIERKNITVKNIKDSIYLRTAQENWTEKQKQTEPQKTDKVGYSYQKEKEFTQQTKTASADERAMPENINEIPPKSEFQKDYEFTFLNELIKYFETNKRTPVDKNKDFELKADMIQTLILENNIDVIIDAKTKQVTIYAHEFFITKFINAKYITSFKEIANKCLPDGWNLDKDFKQIEFEVVYKIVKR